MIETIIELRWEGADPVLSGEFENLVDTLGTEFFEHLYEMEGLAWDPEGLAWDSDPLRRSTIWFRHLELHGNQIFIQMAFRSASKFLYPTSACLVIQDILKQEKECLPSNLFGSGWLESLDIRIQPHDTDPNQMDFFLEDAKVTSLPDSSLGVLEAFLR